MKNNIMQIPRLSVGLDVGDNYCHYAVVDRPGALVAKSRVRTDADSLTQLFKDLSTQAKRLRVTMEVGPHSPWISRLTEELGLETIVADPRRLKLISQNDSKNDATDAEYLARLGRIDVSLLNPVKHRSVRSQTHLALIKSREIMVKSRTMMINRIRGVTKSFGIQLTKCSTESFHRQVPPLLPEELSGALMPLINSIADLTTRIRQYDRDVERIAKADYPETERLRQIRGVGPLTALAYVLVLEDPGRFRNSRQIGAYLGLRPKRDQSGSRDPELRITKAGDGMLRRLLVGSAQYILGPFGEDSDVRRWGLKLAARGGKNAKKKAVVAVARKLASLLYKLWVTGADYEPLRNSRYIEEHHLAEAS